MFRELSGGATVLMNDICEGHAICVGDALSMLDGYDDELYDDVTEELTAALSDGEWDVATAVIGGVELFATYADYETWNNQV